MDGGDSLGGQNGPILRRGIDAVGGNAPHVPDAVPVQRLHGGLAVALNALGMLLPGLGNVYMHAQAVGLGKIRRPLPKLAPGRILGMDGGVKPDLPVSVAVPALGQGLLGHAVVAGLGVEDGVEEHPAAGQVGAQPRGYHFLCHRVGKHIHIGDAGGAGGDHLRQAKGGAAADGPLVPSGLHRKDIVVQPVLKVVPVAVAAHGGHGHMGVAVDQARQQHVALPVDLAAGKALGPLVAHGDDLAALHQNIGVGQHGPGLVHAHGGTIIDEYSHFMLLL